MKLFQEYEKDIASIRSMMERSAPGAAGMLFKKHHDALEAVLK